MSKSRRRFAQEEDNRTVFRGHRPRTPREPAVPADVREAEAEAETKNRS